MHAIRRHGPAAVLFGLLAVAWTFPLVLHSSTHLAGPTFNDNLLSLWNFWSMRTALAGGTNFFYSEYLFAPLGIDLTVYTNTALPAFVGATALGGLPLVAAVNVMVMVALALNGFAAYLLAWRLVRDHAAAAVAGMIFGCSPYLSAHLTGHFDLIGIWTIPAFALAALEANEGAMAWAVVAGAVAGMTAYVAYYYAVYELIFLACVTAVSAWEWSIERLAAGGRQRLWLNITCLALALDVLVMAVTATTGGFDTHIGPVRLRMDETFNQRQAFWVLGGLALWLYYRPRLRLTARGTWNWPRALGILAAVMVSLVVVAAPLVLNAGRLMLRGQYVTQAYYWRSAPIGVDLAALFIGNPFHSVWGEAVRHAYARMGMDPLEAVGWLGILPMILAADAVRRFWKERSVRCWTCVGAVFFVWALGAHLHVGGFNTGLIMPATLVRYLPLVSNVRMPGRALVVTYLAMAMLSAVTIGRRSGSWRHPALTLTAIVALLMADYLATPIRITAMECPEIYQALRARSEPGSLAELPLSLGDGLGNVTTAVDQRMLLCQTIHERPLVGGVTSRLPPGILEYYKNDPLIAAWLRLSGMVEEPGGSIVLPGRELARDRLAANGIAFVLLNRRTATQELTAYVDGVMPLRLIAHDGDHDLYISTTAAR